MNRMEEYQELLKELDRPVPELDGTLERAKRRRSRRNIIYRPLIGVAATFALFILLVNVSTPVAQACSRIPFLRELVEAVTFSNSLTDALENDYVQQVNLEQTDGDVTAKIEYLIVDQKNVAVFYRLYSDVYEEMYAEAKMYTADGSGRIDGNGFERDWKSSDGKLKCMVLDFMEQDVPESMQLVLDVMIQKEVETENDGLYTSVESVAQLEFSLEFDSELLKVGKEITLNETVTIDGQKLTIKNVEVYPTHMRVNVVEDEENAAKLKGLNFYIETKEDETFEAISNGIVASVVKGNPLETCYRADSFYFYDAEELNLLITGATWLRKDMETVHINLETDEAGEFPEGVEFVGAERSNEGWRVTVKAKREEKDNSYMVLGSTFYDAEGNEYDILIHEWPYTEDAEYFLETVPLEGFFGNDVWIKLTRSYEWETKEPVVVKVK